MLKKKGTRFSGVVTASKDRIVAILKPNLEQDEYVCYNSLKVYMRSLSGCPNFTSN